MQDQLRTNISYYGNTDLLFKNINIFLNKINIEVICFGLGSNCFNDKNFDNIINELHDSQKEFIQIISNKSKQFSIRGKYTKKIMDKLNIKNYSIVGCPTFFMNNKKLLKKDIKKLVITGSLDWIEQKPEEITIVGVRIPQDIELFYFCQDYGDVELVKKKKK
jgi:hypothetical protein